MEHSDKDSKEVVVVELSQNAFIVSNDLKPGIRYKYMTLLVKMEGNTPSSPSLWECICRCGQVFYREEARILYSIRHGRFTSCGCSKKEWSKIALNFKGTRRYQIEKQALGICTQCGKRDRNPDSMALCSVCLDKALIAVKKYSRKKGLIKGKGRKSGGRKKLPR